MPQLISSKVVSKDGELLITLNLNINIQTGEVKVKKQEEEDVEWEIPAFDSNEKVKFGKKGD